MTKIQRVRGTQDIHGDLAVAFDHIVRVFSRVARLYGFQHVETPLIEQTAVFARAIGESTDVVSKEMYSFADRNGDMMTLRPELTAGLSRAFVANGWAQSVPLRLYAWGAAFRYERPQKGRYRQFHQIDAEILGAAAPEADVEAIGFAAQFLDELGLTDRVTLELNTVGDAQTRADWRAALIAYFQNVRDALSPDSQERLDRNPLRILDSKDPDDRALAAAAPVIDDYLTPEAGQHFDAVRRGLDAYGVAWQRNARLVRGLDYYRHTAFEFVTRDLGAQGTVIGGGRYDGLVEALGGPSTPSIGWAGGIERLALLVAGGDAPAPDIAVIPLGAAAQDAALALLARLRRADMAAVQSWRGSMKKRMTDANALGARLALILGEDELAQNEVTLKDLQAGTQRRVALDDICAVCAAALADGVSS